MKHILCTFENHSNLLCRFGKKIFLARHEPTVIKQAEHLHGILYYFILIQ